MFIKGYKDDLEIEDLYDPLKDHKSDRLGDILEKYVVMSFLVMFHCTTIKFFRNWKIQLEKCNGKKDATPSFFKAMWATFGWKFMAYGLILLVVELVVK